MHDIQINIYYAFAQKAVETHHGEKVILVSLAPIKTKHIAIAWDFRDENVAHPKMTTKVNQYLDLWKQRLAVGDEFDADLYVWPTAEVSVSEDHLTG